MNGEQTDRSTSLTLKHDVPSRVPVVTPSFAICQCYILKSKTLGAVAEPMDHSFQSSKSTHENGSMSNQITYDIWIKVTRASHADR